MKIKNIFAKEKRKNNDRKISSLDTSKKKNHNKLENKSDKTAQNSTQREKAIENIKKN